MEGKTLTDTVRKKRDKFSVRRSIFVADRGLLSKENLASVKQVEGEFIGGNRIAALSKERPELYDRSKFTKQLQLDTATSADASLAAAVRAHVLLYAPRAPHGPPRLRGVATSIWSCLVARFHRTDGSFGPAASRLSRP
jgi:hypothetical protein